MFRGRLKVLSGVAIVCGVLFTSSPAQALPITGGIIFGGGIGPVADWATVNAIDINYAFALCPDGGGCTGSFDGAGVGLATYNDFSFNPLGGSITPLWSFAGFSFNLTNITMITRTARGIVLTGFGTLFGNGYDPTPAAWSFSADQTGVFGFSSTTSAAPPVVVPDSGSTLILLGAGLLALAFARSRIGV